MPRHRFEHIMANQHFTNNVDVQAASDRAWKVHSVFNTLQETFPRGYAKAPVISFDEGIIPSHNRNNPTRQYLKAKPHKWGTKLFLTCCADTAYCMRLEVYCGKALHVEELVNMPESQRSADPYSGPSAVIGNLEAVLPATQDGVYHLVVTDRFYTSIQLALQLLHRNVYSIGTIMGDKVGYPQEIVEKNRNRPKSVQHGTVRMTVARNCAAMTGFGEMEAVDMLFLAHPWCVITTVGWAEWTSMTNSDFSVILCTADVVQEVLQGYLHGACRRGYCQCLHCIPRRHKRMDLKPASHAEFMLELHAQLLQLKKEDFVELSAASADEDVDAEFLAPLQKDHEPVECPDWKFVNGVRKRRQRLCKVCSILKRKVGERRATKYYCTACSKSETARLYLCNKAWKHYPGNSMMCCQIWHNKWENGSKRPNPRCVRDIQSRAAGTGGGKKRKHHQDTEEKQCEDEAQESRENQADDDELSGCGSGDASAEDSNNE
ncbi:Hypothetical protein PHPALM_18656 [Phytophthora palmivora]|uniref:PiggyBac transposable element-derived protein domain-containing protein n=1 Tax=Phytophthora palmivora TaxID=4796 RepID=A0A2P4XJE8_9STRA|nr:Hypothetical protein PHPALM_18656 [Phytophthora palmivora]